MLLKDNKVFKLPQLQGRWYDGNDRRYIPRSNLMLKEILQREDNGNIELVCKASDGFEEVKGWVHFYDNNLSKKNLLCDWLRLQLGKNVENIYNSEFN